MSVLYFLVNKEQSAFKIGISRHPHRRAKALSVEIDTERSFEIEIVDGDAYRTERTLQYLIRHWRYDMPRGDGYTEWFGIDALAEVISFARAHADKLGLGSIRALKVSNRPASSGHVIPLRESREARAERRARERAELMARAEAHNGQVLEWCKDAFIEMKKSNTIAGLILQPRMIRLAVDTSTCKAVSEITGQTCCATTAKISTAQLDEASQSFSLDIIGTEITR